MNIFRRKAKEIIANNRRDAQQKAIAVDARLKTDETYTAIQSKCNVLVHKIGFLASQNGDCSKFKEELQTEKENLKTYLTTHNIDINSLSPIYKCKMCNDTGFYNNGDCICLQKEMVRLCKENSIGMVTDAIDFDDTEADTIFSDKKENILHIRAGVRAFINNFPKSPKVFGICGIAGVGKSYIASIITNALTAKNFSVLFLSAFKLNELLLNHHIAPLNEKSEILSQLLSPDLLVIDDLGAEPVYNNVTVSGLLMLLTLRSSPIFITTNMEMQSDKQCKEKYDQRVYSRLVDKDNSYWVKMEGSDLRLIKKKVK